MTMRGLGWMALVAGMTFFVAVNAAGKNKAKDKAAPAGGEKDKPAAADAVEAKADNVHIYVQTVPPRKAMVRWGNKSLGMIPAPKPLIIERPRDSGPLDLVIRASGYLPVHTRVYTFSDSHVSVKVTPPTEKNKLFGYKQEPTPSPEAAPGADGVTGPVQTPAPVPAP
jgi:hypothetical protein